MKSLTVNSVIADLNAVESYDEVLALGGRVKSQIMMNRSSPYLPLDVYDQEEDLMKARNFMVGVICS